MNNFRDEQLIYDVVCTPEVQETETDSRYKTAPEATAELHRNFAG